MYESIMKNTYNVIKQLCLYYTYKRLWQGYIYLYSVHFPSMFKLDSECVYVWVNVLLHWQFCVSEGEGGTCQCTGYKALALPQAFICII